MSKKVFALLDMHAEFGIDDDGNRIVHGYFYEGKQLEKIKQAIQCLEDNNYAHYQEIGKVIKLNPNKIITEESMNKDFSFWIDFVQQNFERASVEHLVPQK